ncbi:MAG: hypothetical protein ACLQAH_16910 [Limisphaerales bacterium]
MGLVAKKILSPAGAAENKQMAFSIAPVGLGLFLSFNPRLTPWAIVFRASGAEHCRRENAGHKWERKIMPET